MNETPPPNGGATPGAAAATARGASRAHQAGAAARRVWDTTADGARISFPVIKRWGTRFGDWLARVGWGKFFLLALLLVICAGFASALLDRRSPVVVIDKRAPRDRVEINVSVGPDGIRVTPPATPATPSPPDTPQADGKPGRAGVAVDDRGVRMFVMRDGKPFVIAIDDRGVRFEDAQPGERDVVIPVTGAQDKKKAAEAVEAAREKIEQIVEEQIQQEVDREVKQRVRQIREDNSSGIVPFVLLMIIALIILKIVLGSKSRAEKRAQAATATAAEEGLKRQLAEAQLKMMQAQVEPHFLFNTLASVDYLIETDPGRASKMQKNLIQYLRAALPQMREGSTTLGKELALCRAYLEILKVRMDDRLQFSMIVPQGLATAQFPPMMLQSLVENSIKHGLEPKAEGGSLTISADIASGNLRVSVADTGLGFAVAGQTGTGVGLTNVRERLAALYGGRARLNVAANTPSGTIATIEVPYTYDDPAGAATPVRQPA
jgi:hypothetical protein